MAGIASVTAVAALTYRHPPGLPGNANAKKAPAWTKDIFDVTLLKDKCFLVFLLGISLYASGCFIPASYAVSFCSRLNDNHLQRFLRNFSETQEIV